MESCFLLNYAVHSASLQSALPLLVFVKVFARGVGRFMPVNVVGIEREKQLPAASFQPSALSRQLMKISRRPLAPPQVVKPKAVGPTAKSSF